MDLDGVELLCIKFIYPQNLFTLYYVLASPNNDAVAHQADVEIYR